MADNRGRIQLPQPFRQQKLFELVESDGVLSLYPLRLERLDSKMATAKPAPELWLNSEVSRFLKDAIFPKLRNFAETQKVFKLEHLFCMDHARLKQL